MSNTISNNGRLSLIMRVYNTLTDRLDTIMYQKDPNIWYKDSLIIEETFYADFDMNDTTFETTWVNRPYEYTFIDLPKREFYTFSSFSDTATLIRKYTQSDSVRGSLANFWGKVSGSTLKNAIPMKDTILEDVNYKRYKTTFYVMSNDAIADSSINIVYMLCNTTKPKMFTINKAFSEEHNGCPVKRMDYYGKGTPYIVVDYLFLFDILTVNEEKVFNAWAKYAKEHPVEK